MQKRKNSQKTQVSGKSQELFHYTSISALQGILETNSLWATRISHLNDLSEMQMIWPRIQPHVVEFYEEDLREFCRLNPDINESVRLEGGVARIANYDGLIMAKELHSRLQGHIAVPSLQERFVVSFTTHDRHPVLDDYHRKHGMLSQWRGYGTDEGVALVFSRPGIEELRQTEYESFHYWQSSLWDVIYDFNDVGMEDHFPKLYRLLRDFVHSWIFQNHDRLGLESLLDSVYRELLLAVTRFKHIAFHEEQECRIVMGVIQESCLAEFDSAGEDGVKSFKQIHHRKGSCGSIPYIRLFEDSGLKLPIKRIIVGPSRNQDAHIEWAQQLVGNREIIVQRSDTPFV